MTSPISSCSGSLWKVSWGWSWWCLGECGPRDGLGDGPRVVVGTDLGMDPRTTNRGTQTNKPRVSPTVPLCSPPDSPSDDLCAFPYATPQAHPCTISQIHRESLKTAGTRMEGRREARRRDQRETVRDIRAIVESSQTTNPQGVAVNSLGGRLKDSIKVGHSISSFYWSA